ncbi:hypothetical protein AciX9_1254 [Granulicella tundricola MP5ACTX9]|uniref:Uncharacterized protein n=1 Tax=Granulicella tundricola (strain ATCC BAA-1859 / DSM 23138 / MP5ACTX9) TaxID=1198114 RepID=E8X552_GRATM|nr:hypothetical protein AciX9_1254 [Granulicella tundricola MP5ACTX9]
MPRSHFCVNKSAPIVEYQYGPRHTMIVLTETVTPPPASIKKEFPLFTDIALALALLSVIVAPALIAMRVTGSSQQRDIL